MKYLCYIKYETHSRTPKVYVYVCLTVIKKSSSLSLYDDVFEISNYTYLAYTALFLKVNDSSINNTMTSCEFFFATQITDISYDSIVFLSKKVKKKV